MEDEILDTEHEYVKAMTELAHVAKYNPNVRANCLKALGDSISMYRKHIRFLRIGGPITVFFMVFLALNVGWDIQRHWFGTALWDMTMASFNMFMANVFFRDLAVMKNALMLIEKLKKEVMEVSNEGNAM